MLQVRRHLERDRLPGSARTVALRIAALDNKPRFVAVKFEAVVEASVRELDEVLSGYGRQILIQFKPDNALACVQFRDSI